MPELPTPALGPGEQDRKEGELPLTQSLSGGLFHRVSGICLVFLSSLFRPTTSPVPRSTFQLPGIMIFGKQSKKLGGYFIIHLPLGNTWPRFQRQVTGVDTAWPKGRNMGPERESFGDSSTKQGCDLVASLSKGSIWMKTKKYSLGSQNYL